MVRIVMDSDAPGAIAIAVENFLDTKIGPLIVADAKRYAPKRTGAMAASIRHEVTGMTLYVLADSPAYWVELGHAVFHPSTKTTGPQQVPEEPFLRPALYKYRTPQLPDPPATTPVAIPRPETGWEVRMRESLRGEVVRSNQRAFRNPRP